MVLKANNTEVIYMDSLLGLGKLHLHEKFIFPKV